MNPQESRLLKDLLVQLPPEPHESIHDKKRREAFAGVIEDLAILYYQRVDAVREDLLSDLQATLQLYNPSQSV